MNNFWRRAKPFICGALCVFLALYLSPLSAQINYAIATHDISPFWIWLFPNGAFLFIFPGMIIGIVSPCFVLTYLVCVRFRGAKLTPFVGYIALMWLFSWLSFALFLPITPQKLKQRLWPMRRAGLQQAATRARPLINAIEKFKAENKRLPTNLQELVPKYLPEIPPTGMAAYPQFRYKSREQSGESARFTDYQLQVSTPTRFFNWDAFIYWPEANYPTEMYGGRVERIGNWAYVHE